MGAGDDYRRCEFVRLGYLSLDGNEASGYKARELKSVYIKARGNFVKLLLHRCYVNAPNLFNQVGLVAVNVLGGGGPAAEGRAHAAEPAAARRCVYEGGGGVGAGRGLHSLLRRRCWGCRLTPPPARASAHAHHAPAATAMPRRHSPAPPPPPPARRWGA